MPGRRRTSFSVYAREKIIRKLLDLQDEHSDLTWSSMAADISIWRSIEFDRVNFTRLRNGTLGDENINIILDWIEAHHDEEFRLNLSPDSIFKDFGISSRDYYFHLPAPNNLDDWEEQVFEQFSGVYLCAPAGDKNTFLPVSHLKGLFEDNSSLTPEEIKNRSLDIKQYIQQRTILILQRTVGSYFHAAEFPMSLLFPRSFVTLDHRLIYEGIAVASSNSINVTLRECMSRVPKTHSILISPKNHNQAINPFGLSVHLPPGTEKVRDEWHKLGQSHLDHMLKEFAWPIDADYFMSGCAQISLSPVPYLRNKVHMNYPLELVYHRKPKDFLRHKELHFIRPELDIHSQVQKIIDSPLSIGGLI